MTIAVIVILAARSAVQSLVLWRLTVAHRRVLDAWLGALDREAAVVEHWRQSNDQFAELLAKHQVFVEYVKDLTGTST